jgi:hypothetical protein
MPAAELRAWKPVAAGASELVGERSVSALGPQHLPLLLPCLPHDVP